MLIMITYTVALSNRYNHININNISEKEAIIEMYKNEKSFGESENRKLKKLIEKISVNPQNNFWNYYV